MKYLYAVQQLGRFITITVFTVAACFSWAVDKPLNPSEAKLAVEAHQILVAHCGKCHGKGGSYSDDMLLDYDQLIEEAFIVKGKSGESDLYGVIADGSMPPKKAKNPVAAKDAEVIKRWIDEGAPDWNLAPQQKREFVSKKQVFASVFKDLSSLGDREKRFARYYDLTHLYNAGFEEDTLENYRLALSKLVNSLSWNRQITPPKAINKEKTVLRLDLRDYDWDRDTWGVIVRDYPYHINYDFEEYDRSTEVTTAEIPLIRADWFIARAALPPLYHDILELPQNDGELESKLNIKVLQNITDSPGRKVWRSGFLKSGVSQFNRIVERHESPYGAYWKSYDFDSNEGFKNIFRYPYKFEFHHAGGEIIFNLPNGLQAYLLTDEKGKRIDEAPVSIVSNRGNPNPVISNGLTCMACHTRGMKRLDFADELHKAISVTEYARERKQDLEDLYPSADIVNKLINEDIVRYEKAVEETGSVAGNKEPVALLTDRYHEVMNSRLAAAELDLTEKEFLNKLGKHEQLKKAGMNTLVGGGTIARENWELLYPSVVLSLRAGNPKFLERQLEKFRGLSFSDPVKGNPEMNNGKENSSVTIPTEELIRLRKELEESQRDQAAVLKQINDLQAQLKDAQTRADREKIDRQIIEASRTIAEKQKANALVLEQIGGHSSGARAVPGQFMAKLALGSTRATVGASRSSRTGPSMAQADSSAMMSRPVRMQGLRALPRVRDSLNNTNQNRSAGDAAYEAGAGLFNLGLWKQSSESFKEYFANHPNHEMLPYAHFGLGLCHLNLENFADAESEFRKSLSGVGPSKSVLNLYLGQALLLRTSAEPIHAEVAFRNSLQELGFKRTGIINRTWDKTSVGEWLKKVNDPNRLAQARAAAIGFLESEYMQSKKPTEVFDALLKDTKHEERVKFLKNTKYKSEQNNFKPLGYERRHFEFQHVPSVLDITPSQGSSFSPVKVSQATARTGSSGSTLELFRTRGFEYTAEGKGDDYVFIIDKSKSMKDDRRLIAAKEALARTLEKLGPNKRFYVFFFSDDTVGMEGGRLLEATPANVEHTQNWAGRMSPEGFTDPRDALADAFGKLKPSTIWLLSDGKFSPFKRVKRGNRTEVVGLPPVYQIIEKLNPNGAVRVNTIGFADSEQDVDDSLKAIAKENDGTYRFIKSNER